MTEAQAGTGTDHSEGILARVARACSALLEAAQPYGGLMPSILERSSTKIPQTIPAPIPGQRMSDRAYPGCNLIHDVPTLKTLAALGPVLGRVDFAEGADRYLARFATHCTNTATGLFPWGEHAFWDLHADQVGDSFQLANPGRKRGAIHDHLRQAPLWLWEKLYTFNPACVERFAEGLDYHWQEGEPREYIRHAAIEERVYPKRGPRACDFPRHSGFYIFDWTYAFAKTRRPDFARQVQRMLDYWWEKRDEHNLLLIESRSPADERRFFMVNAPPQTLSLAASLLESADLIEPLQPNLAQEMRLRAGAYTEGFLAAPHDPTRGLFVLLSRRGSGEIVESTPIWGSVYGVWPLAYVALTCLCVYRFTQDPRLLRWAEEAGRCYAHAPIPQRVHIPAMDVGLALGLMADLFDLTGRRYWLETGMGLAREAVALYFGAPQRDASGPMAGALPRGAVGIEYYDAQMGPGYLLHGLVRLALLDLMGKECPLEADYTAR